MEQLIKTLNMLNKMSMKKADELIRDTHRKRLNSIELTVEDESILEAEKFMKRINVKKKCRKPYTEEEKQILSAMSL